MWESVFTAAANSTSASTLTTVAAGNMSSFVIPFGGSALVGFLMGYALKKIIKWALIILGVFLGIILVIQYMTNNGYITGKILWDKMGNDIFGILPAFFLLLLIPSSPYSL